MSAKNSSKAQPKRARLYEAMVALGRLVDEMERVREDYGDLIEQKEMPEDRHTHPWIDFFEDVAQQYGREESRANHGANLTRTTTSGGNH
ncbi:hypothetical protein J8F10_01635 [Gemmata sp. G18]|uniref:Uncharacterized protein n=1 Tax=Gemmata palustris TaxID=2822762 RepID=A0ABS5BJX8_9BACT|nr:hypothetical protein [Gemmata palustris]MBP3953999.1 hypothetical protein [Gemmata palustris]